MPSQVTVSNAGNSSFQVLLGDFVNNAAPTGGFPPDLTVQVPGYRPPVDWVMYPGNPPAVSGDPWTRPGYWIVGPDGHLVATLFYITYFGVTFIIGAPGLVLYSYADDFVHSPTTGQADFGDLVLGGYTGDAPNYSPGFPRYGYNVRLPIVTHKGIAPGVYTVYEGTPRGYSIYGSSTAYAVYWPYDIYRMAQFTVVDGLGTGTGTPTPPPPPPPTDTKNVLSYTLSPARRRFRAFSAKPATGTDPLHIWVGQSTNATGHDWTDVDTGLVCASTGGSPSIRFAHDGTLWLAYVAAGIKLTHSENDGKAWSDPVSIAAGSLPCLVTTADGRRLVYYKSGAAMKGVFLDGTPAAGVQVAEFTAIASGVDGLSVAENVVTGGVWQAEAIINSGGTLKFFKSSPDGKTFTEVTS